MSTAKKSTLDTPAAGSGDEIQELMHIDIGALHGCCPLIDGGNVTVQQFVENAPTIVRDYGPVGLIGYASNVVIC
jgi:hypothetical protein